MNTDTPTYSVRTIRGQDAAKSVLQKAMLLNWRVLLIGEQGCGKTELVMEVARDSGWEFMRFNMTGETGTDDFVGTMTLVKGETVFVEKMLPTAMRKKCVLLIDEINMANAEILTLLKPLLDGSRFISLSGKDGEIVHAHPDFRLFATMNPTTYEGTKDLSPAIKSHFKRLEIDYVEPLVEVDILKEAADIPDVEATQIVSVANAIRAAHRAGEVGLTISTRDTIAWAETTKEIDVHTGFLLSVLNGVESPTDRARLIAEYERINGETKRLTRNKINPINLITQADTLRAEFDAREKDLSERQRLLEQREKLLATDIIRKAVTGATEGPPPRKRGRPSKADLEARAAAAALAAAESAAVEAPVAEAVTTETT